MNDTATTRAIETTWRMESARLIAGLTRMVRDVGLAEDLAQEALLAALQRWPDDGVPANPGAWLMTAAKNRARDRFRHSAMAAGKLEDLGKDADLERPDPAAALEARLDDDVNDDLLSLIFTACHPAISPEGRLALTLKVVAGLKTGEIARAFLTGEAVIAQRIVRAKRALAEAHYPFEVPRGHDRAQRLGSVLEVVYLIFNEGYAATGGADWMRPALCAEAVRLGRILAGLMPREPEVHGLVALMEIQSSREAARSGPDGTPVLLLDQDRALWDRLLIRRGLAALELAERLGGARGPYALQAAIAACHARASAANDTDWNRLAALYDVLAEVLPSPVVRLNRAVAHGFAFGPEAGLALADALAGEPRLERYHLLPAVRADFLFRLGRFRQARAAFLEAAELTGNDREKTLLAERAAACLEQEARREG